MYALTPATMIIINIIITCVIVKFRFTGIRFSSNGDLSATVSFHRSQSFTKTFQQTNLCFNVCESGWKHTYIKYNHFSHFSKFILTFLFKVITEVCN